MPSTLKVEYPARYFILRPGVHLLPSHAERLEIRPSQHNLSFEEPTKVRRTDFEHQITDSLQGLKILNQDLVLDGLLSKQVHSILNVHDCMTPHIQAYKNSIHKTSLLLAQNYFPDSMGNIKLYSTRWVESYRAELGQCRKAAPRRGRDRKRSAWHRKGR